jgi:molecular chaperone GrpE (heat shock protein)
MTHESQDRAVRRANVKAGNASVRGWITEADRAAFDAMTKRAGDALAGKPEPTFEELQKLEGDACVAYLGAPDDNDEAERDAYYLAKSNLAEAKRKRKKRQEPTLEELEKLKDDAGRALWDAPDDNDDAEREAFNLAYSNLKEALRKQEAGL